MLYLTSKTSGLSLSVEPDAIEALQLNGSGDAYETQVFLKSGKSFTVVEAPALINEAKAVLQKHVYATVGGVTADGAVISGVTVSSEGHTLVTYKEGTHVRGGVTE